MIAFLRLSFTLIILRSHFGSFCSIAAFDSRILAAFAQSQHPTVAFWQLSLSPRPPPPPLPPVLAHDRIFTAFAHSHHSKVAFWQLLLNCSIRQSHFGSFCSIAAFDGGILAAFPLPAFFHAAPAPRSRVRSQFCSFRSLSEFDSPILSAFAQSPHSTVAFWQLFRTPHSPSSPLPPRSRVRSHFYRFPSLSPFDGRVLATFAQLQHSTVAF